MKLILPLLAILYLLCSCSFAPLTTPKTGRSLGDGNWQIDGNILPAIGLSVSRGFSENWDAGLLVEKQAGDIFSAWGKYSIVNKPESFSFAMYGGAFIGRGYGISNGFYVGPIGSYKKKWFETYLSVKYNYVSWRYDESFGSTNRSDSIIELVSIEDVNFSYIQFDFGMNFWTSENFAINIHGKSLLFIGDKITASSSVIPGISLIFNL